MLVPASGWKACLKDEGFPTKGERRDPACECRYAAGHRAALADQIRVTGAATSLGAAHPAQKSCRGREELSVVNDPVHRSIVEHEQTPAKWHV